MKYCEQCGAELQDDNKFCSKCGGKCEENDFESNKKEKRKKKVSGKRKKNLLVGVGIFVIILIIAGSVSGFFSDFKKGYEEAEKPKVESKNEMGLKRSSKQYDYNFVTENVPTNAEWFVESGELYCIENEKLKNLNKESGNIENVNDMEIDKCYSSSGNNEWIVFSDGECIYKHSVTEKNTELLMALNDEETMERVVGNEGVVIDNNFYYYSENYDNYSPLTGANAVIYKMNLEGDSDNQIVAENVSLDSLIVAGKGESCFYYAESGENETPIKKYDCKTGNSETIGVGNIRNLLVNGRNCYLFEDDLILINEKGEKCLKTDLSFPVDQVIQVGEYLVCDSDSMETLFVISGENIYEIKKAWGEEWDYGVGNVILVQNNRLWFMAYGGVGVGTNYIYSVDFEGNLSDTKEWIALEEGEVITYFDGNLWVSGQPKEEWEIDKEVDDLVVDEIEKQGYDVASFGQYENGKTELTMNVGKYGLYYIPILKENSGENDLQEEESNLQETKPENENKGVNQPENNIVNENNQVDDLVRNFQGFSGVWGDFGVHADAYQGMIEQAVKSTISLSDYFGGDVNDVYLEVSSFQWDGANIIGAGCILTFEGPSPGNGQFRTLTGTVSVEESGDLQFIETNYY